MIGALEWIGEQLTTSDISWKMELSEEKMAKAEDTRMNGERIGSGLLNGQASGKGWLTLNIIPLIRDLIQFERNGKGDCSIQEVEKTVD